MADSSIAAVRRDKQFPLVHSNVHGFSTWSTLKSNYVLIECYKAHWLWQRQCSNPRWKNSLTDDTQESSRKGCLISWHSFSVFWDFDFASKETHKHFKHGYKSPQSLQLKVAWKPSGRRRGKVVNNLSSVSKIYKNMKNSVCCNTLIYSLQRTAAFHLIDLWNVTSLDMNLTWNVSVFHSSCTFMIFSQGDREGSKSQKIHVRSWESSSWIGVLFMELSTPLACSWK